MVDPRPQTSRRVIFMATAATIFPRCQAIATQSPQSIIGLDEGFDIRRFGAIGDGRSHRLSALYRTLREARNFFPHALSLEQETDTCALQAAINAAEAAGGGTVRAGSGVFMIDQNVVFPEARQGFGLGPQGGVSLIGAGQGATVFRAVHDFPGYMFDCARRFETNWGSQGTWQDFSMRGPGKYSKWGASSCNLGGLGWGARRAVSRVTVQDCRVGISVTGDQGMIDHFFSLSCTYGVYFDKPNPVLFGDLLFEKIVLDGSWRSAIGVHPDASIPKSQWNSCIFAGSPFGIYKEFGGSTNFAARSVHMSHAQFENIGLAAISGGDQQGRDLGVRPDTQNLRFTMTQFGPWDDQRLVPSWQRAAMFDIGQCHQGLVIDGINEPQLWEPGDIALLRASFPGALRISGDIEALLLACRRHGRPFLHATNRSDDIAVEDIGRWSGRIYHMDAGRLAQPGDVLVHSRGNVTLSTGASDEPVAGICMSAPKNTYEAIVVANAGQVHVNSIHSEVDNAMLYSGRDGKATKDVGGSRIGWSYSKPDGQTRVRLIGLG